MVKLRIKLYFKEIKIVKVIIKLNDDNKCKETASEIY